MSAFNWADPFDLESAAHRGGAARPEDRLRLFPGQAAPRVLEAFRHEKTDPAIFREMGELGFLGPTVAPEYGGSGLGYVAYGLIAREVERVDSGYRSMMSVQSSLVMLPIEQFGSPGQKEKYLPKLAQRRVDRLFRPHRARPRLRPRLDGHAREEGRRRLQPLGRQNLDQQRPDRRRLSSSGPRPRTARSAASSWRRATKGLEAPAIHGKVGLRASITGQILLDDAFVPEENLLPGVHGLKGPFTCLNSARFGIAWGALGAAESCYSMARQYVMDRKQFGRPLAANQLIQKKLADMATDIRWGCRAACGSAA